MLVAQFTRLSGPTNTIMRKWCKEITKRIIGKFNNKFWNKRNGKRDLNNIPDFIESLRSRSMQWVEIHELMVHKEEKHERYGFQCYFEVMLDRFTG